jgi:hypothetical protein
VEARIIQEYRREAVETEARRRLLASEGDAGVLLGVRRGDRTRTAPPGERIGCRSRCSWVILASQVDTIDLAERQVHAESRF